MVQNLLAHLKVSIHLKIHFDQLLLKVLSINAVIAIIISSNNNSAFNFFSISFSQNENKTKMEINVIIIR